MRRIMAAMAVAGVCLMLYARQEDSARGGIPRQLSDLIARADSGDAAAQYRYAGVLERGYATIRPDTAAALLLYEKAACAGYAPAQSYLGFLYYKAPHRDVARALEWMESAARSGDPKACNNLGWLLMEGEGVEHDYAKARYWLRRAADEELPVAKAQLGDLYRKGLGVEADTTAARHLYEDAIAGGFLDAQYPLKEMMMPYFATLTPQEMADLGTHYRSINAFDLALALFEMGAQAGNADALTMLGNAYSRGEGVEYSHAKSLEYFYRGAIAGNEDARRAVAELLEVFPDALEELPDSLKNSTIH